MARTRIPSRPGPRFRRAVGLDSPEAPAGGPEDEATRARVLAQSQAWMEAAVIGLNLCPFAKAVAARGQIRWQLSPARHAEALLAELVEALQALAEADPAQHDTTLIVHPWVLGRFDDFNAFLGLAEAAIEAAGLRGVLQLAAFHPRWRFAEHAPGDPAHASNRAPWPTLHLLREASVARAVAAVPEAATIFERNIATLRALGEPGWQALSSRWLDAVATGTDAARPPAADDPPV